MMSPVVVPRIETVVVPHPAGGRIRVRVMPLLLACCGVEVASALGPLLGDRASDGMRVDQRVEPTNVPLSEQTVLVVAGTVTDASEASVLAAYDAIPGAKSVLAFGACTASGGPYWDSYCVAKGIGHLVPVSLVVPGCPPRPEALITALAALVTTGVATGTPR